MKNYEFLIKYFILYGNTPSETFIEIVVSSSAVNVWAEKQNELDKVEKKKLKAFLESNPDKKEKDYPNAKYTIKLLDIQRI
jgi:hypothetical protein